MMLPDLYILRHGQTEWNREGRWQGREDSPLTETGIEQAESQGKILAALTLDETRVALYASPQGRARRTAEIIVKTSGWSGELRFDDRLVEIDVGDWTGLRRDDLRARVDLDESLGFLELYALAPGGEGFVALEARCRAFLSELAGPAVIVTHGITSRFLRAAALGLDPHQAEALPGGQGNIFRISKGRHEECRLPSP